MRYLRWLEKWEWACASELAELQARRRPPSCNPVVGPKVTRYGGRTHATDSDPWTRIGARSKLSPPGHAPVCVSVCVCAQARGFSGFWVLRCRAFPQFVLIVLSHKPPPLPPLSLPLTGRGAARARALVGGVSGFYVGGVRVLCLFGISGTAASPTKGRIRLWASVKRPCCSSLRARRWTMV